MAVELLYVPFTVITNHSSKVISDIIVRVETEHLGNADAYRVTREIPLPYRNLDLESEDEAEGKSLKQRNPVKSRWKAILHRLKDGGPAGGASHGHNASSEETGSAGRGQEESETEHGTTQPAAQGQAIARARTREYEARQPGEGPVKSGQGSMDAIEDKWLSLVRRLRERKRRSAEGQAPS